MYRKRRVSLALIIAAAIVVTGFLQGSSPIFPAPSQTQKPPAATPDGTRSAATELERLAVKGRAPKTGYTRAQFGNGWRESGECDTRNDILARDLKNVAIQNCKVTSGTLDDPYTGKTISFQRGTDTSSKIQIDHIVALSDAWQKGAQGLGFETRENLANDPLELLAVDGPANQNKGDGDAATWLPPNKTYRCRYVARQVAVKQKYSLWLSEAEKNSMKNILGRCPGQLLPV